ncbi:lysine decarboxylase [Salmonella enterica subsp. enterica]|nr:lysine decarboxylase [Salmonella enterica subsp. enterica]
MCVKGNILSVRLATWAGTAFQKSPVGSIFYDFFGPNTMKSDISISVSELGSLLDHSGPHKEAEEYIARVFNAERSYMVTNGTSTANKIVGMLLRAGRQHGTD